MQEKKDQKTTLTVTATEGLNETQFNKNHFVSSSSFSLNVLLLVMILVLFCLLDRHTGTDNLGEGGREGGDDKKESIKEVEEEGEEDGDREEEDCVVIARGEVWCLCWRRRGFSALVGAGIGVLLGALVGGYIEGWRVLAGDGLGDR